MLRSLKVVIAAALFATGTVASASYTIKSSGFVQRGDDLRNGIFSITNGKRFNLTVKVRPELLGGPLNKNAISYQIAIEGFPLFSFIGDAPYTYDNTLNNLVREENIEGFDFYNLDSYRSFSGEGEVGADDFSVSNFTSLTLAWYSANNFLDGDLKTAPKHAIFTLPDPIHGETSDTFFYAYQRVLDQEGHVFSLTGSDYELVTTGYAVSVPEPAAWGMMVVGFGAIGGALRTRRKVVASS